ncbi:fimbrillin family protein [Bacteroides uniformis]|uniref:fimbrillin family protein n=1 Tax=Bacteroides uniformis TaxID=820 RepID=UPI001D07E188|nr:fimbrillin family protein [Bacteroides uniformis]MCB6980512.1 fimbrillin family protein [Bacteroides uniformis]MCB7028321.1 fimbrillin family protein [Bacteroides uniformis]
MNIKVSTLPIAVAAFCMASCSSEDDAPATSKYITVATSIGQMTRTTINAEGIQEFADGDKISVYAWTGEATTVPAALVVNNSINTFDGTKWTAVPQMLWKDMTTPHYFLSIYPDRAVTDFTADEYTLDTENQEASDLLVAENTGTKGAGLVATANPVSLMFNHVMAKLVVNLQFRNQWATTPTVTSVTAMAKNTATVNYVTASGTVVTVTGEPGSIALPATTANTCYTSVMVPQSGFRNISIVIDGKTYSFAHTEDIALESGKYTTVNLIVGRNEITLGSVSINHWQEGASINGGEAQTDKN